MKKRVKSGTTKERSCGCIDIYRPGPEGWTVWSHCTKHARERAARQK